MPRGKSKTGPVLDEGPYEVEAIVDKRLAPDGTKVEYQVQWKAKKFKGRNTWETRESLLMGCEEMLEDFEEELNRQNTRSHNKSKRCGRSLTTVAAVGDTAEISDWKVSRDHLSTHDTSGTMDVDDDDVTSTIVTNQVWNGGAGDASDEWSTTQSVQFVTELCEGTSSMMLGGHRKSIRPGASAGATKYENTPEYLTATTSAKEPSRPQEQLSQGKPQQDTWPFDGVFPVSTAEIFRCEGCRYYVNDMDTFINHLRNQAHSNRANGRCLKCSGCPFTSSKPEKIKQHIQKYNFHNQPGKDLGYFFFRDM